MGSVKMFKENIEPQKKKEKVSISNPSRLSGNPSCNVIPPRFTRATKHNLAPSKIISTNTQHQHSLPNSHFDLGEVVINWTYN